MLEKGTKCVVCDELLSDDERGDVDDDEFDAVDPPRVCMACWKCPKCDNDGREDEFITDEGYANCAKCGTGFNFKELEKKLVKKANRVTCPHCNGSGFIDGKKIERNKKNAKQK